MERGPRVGVRLVYGGAVEEQQPDHHQVVVQHGLVERRHARRVHPVDVDVDAGSPQHRHDGFPVRLLDALLEHDLVREPHSP